MSSIGSADFLLDTSINRLSAILVVGRAGRFASVHRAKLGVRERGCVFDFLASRGGDLNV